VSANGRIIVEAGDISKGELLRAWRAIILELDNKIFRYLGHMNNYASVDTILDTLTMITAGPNEKQIEERIKRWLRILLDSELLSAADNKIKVNTDNLKGANKDLRLSCKKSKYEGMLLSGYRAFPFKESAGIVDIADLREYVAALYYTKYNMILTEMQFDELLRALPFITKEYIISLGHAMGAEEKLFCKKGEYYRTISIDFLKKEVRHD
jgi:hypothetical protein